MRLIILFTLLYFTSGTACVLDALVVIIIFICTLSFAIFKEFIIIIILIQDVILMLWRVVEVEKVQPRHLSKRLIVIMTLCIITSQP